MEEVEFVGHILKTDGIHFSSEKRSKVVDFVVQSRLGDSENLRLDRQDRVVNITARVNG